MIPFSIPIFWIVAVSSILILSTTTDPDDPVYIQRKQSDYQHNKVIGMSNGVVYDNFELPDTESNHYHCAMDPLGLAQIIVAEIKSYRWRCSQFDQEYYSELCPERAPVSVSASTTPPLGETYIYPKAGYIDVTTCCSTENQYLRSTANVLIQYYN